MQAEALASENPDLEAFDGGSHPEASQAARTFASIIGATAVTKTTVGLVVAIVLLALLVSAGPTLVALIEAAVPLVIAMGVVGAGLRIVWLVTERYR